MDRGNAGPLPRRAVEMTDDRFQEIYTNKKLRNAVSQAHGVFRRPGERNPIHKKALYWPEEIIVTDAHIAEAKAEVARAKERTLRENVGKLILVGMGMEIQGEHPDRVPNHRVRGNFYNDARRLCFVEFQNHQRFSNFKGSRRWMFIPHAIIEGREIFRHENWERAEYTLTEVLRAVNMLFGASFDSIHVDNYDLGPDDFISDRYSVRI